MIEVLVAFSLGCAAGLTPLVLVMRESQRRAESHESDRLSWTVERGALVDRVQSPDLVAYYGARQAWHPAEFPAPPVQDFQRDEFGFIAEEAERPVDAATLPGELPAGS